MRLMSDYITKLEGFPDLEVSIIRATKINKVLKAILKLENIPKEDEFNFKSRSQVLLDKWNKLLTADAPTAPSAEANGVNGSAKEEKKEAAPSKTNGVKKEKSDEPAAKEEVKEEKEDVEEEEATAKIEEVR